VIYSYLMHAVPNANDTAKNLIAAKPARRPVSSGGCKSQRTKITFVALIMLPGSNAGERPIRAIGGANRKNGKMRYKIP